MAFSKLINIGLAWKCALVISSVPLNVNIGEIRPYNRVPSNAYKYISNILFFN